MLGYLSISESTKQKAIQWIEDMKAEIEKRSHYEQTSQYEPKEREVISVVDAQIGDSIKLKGKYFTVVKSEKLGDYQMLELLRRGKTTSVAVDQETMVERLF